MMSPLSSGYRIGIYDDVGAVEYVQHMGSDLTVVNSARVSFGKNKEKLDSRDKKLIRYLIRHRHTSTLEHNSITLKFTVPLFVRSQHHRHRTWSYNEISRRYTSVDIKFYEPNVLRSQHKSNRQASDLESAINPIVVGDLSGDDDGWRATTIIRAHHEASLNLYNRLLSQGICREQARGILPQNLYTEYYGTVNLNNLLKFIELRTHEGAQAEIQEVANACLKIAKMLWPETIAAYEEIRRGK